MKIRLFKRIHVSAHVRYKKVKHGGKIINVIIPVNDYYRTIKKVVNLKEVCNFLNKGYSFI